MGDETTDREPSAAGWTGGQWSVVRWAIGALIAGRGLWLAGEWLLGVADSGSSRELVAALVLSLLGALLAVCTRGPGTWWATALLLFALLSLAARHPHFARWEGWAWFAVYVLVVWAPSAPFLSWEARGRTDPRGDWRMPAWWTVLALLAWLAATVLWFVEGHTALLLPWAALLLCCFRPDWLPPLEGGTDRLFYDGDCGLCHRAVRFVLAEETRGTVRVAPLHGETFERELSEAQRTDLPDSLIVLTDDGEVLTRDRAVLRLLRRCGGVWRVLGGLLRLVPTPIRRWGYDRIAAVRRALFETPSGACPILPPDLRARFDP